MTNSKNLRLLVGTSITLAYLKLTVGGEMNAKVKSICFTFVSICLFGLLGCVDKTKEENKSLSGNDGSKVKNELEGA